MFSWVNFLSYAVVTAVTPEPNNLMSMSNAGRLGFKRAPVTDEDGQGKGGFVSGLALQFVNPKIYIYCIVSMEAYILPYYQGQWPEPTLFALLLAFIGFVFTLCWALFGSVFRMLFSKYARVTNTVMALLLVYCAVSLFL